jgi:uncharacterized protein
VIVKPNRYPLRLNVGFIISQSIGFSRDFEFDFPTISLLSDLDLTDFHGVARISRTPQGLLCHAKIHSSMTLECVRCVEPAVVPLQAEYDELFAFTPRTMSESGLLLPEDAHIDLEPLIHEYLTLEIPIRPLCRPDCQGLCPECGENWNERDCEHRSKPMD